MHGYKINKEIGLLTIKCAGEVSIGHLAQVLMAVLTDPDYSLSMDTLTDLRGMTSTFSYQEMQDLVERLDYPQEIVSKTKSAILVDKDVTYGMGRIWVSITEYGDFAEPKVFWSLEEARNWLGLPPGARIEFPF